MADCSEQRAAFEAADALARSAVNTREAARAEFDVATQAAENARDVAAQAEQAEEEAAASLDEAIADANSAIEASNQAYQEWVNCQILDSADTESVSAARVTAKAVTKKRRKR